LCRVPISCLPNRQIFPSRPSVAHHSSLSVFWPFYFFVATVALSRGRLKRSAACRCFRCRTNCFQGTRRRRVWPRFSDSFRLAGNQTSWADFFTNLAFRWEGNSDCRAETVHRRGNSIDRSSRTSNPQGRPARKSAYIRRRIRRPASPPASRVFLFPYFFVFFA